MDADPHGAWPCARGEMAARIGAHDWARTPLGPVGSWSERLRLMVEQVLATPLVATLVCGAERILIYNDAAARLYGARHPAALGRPLPEAFPEGWEAVAPHYERAFAGETVQVAAQPLDTRGEGGGADLFDALLTPVREADGHVACVHMTGLEFGGALRAEAALRAEDAQYRQLFDAIDEGFCVLEVVFDEAERPSDCRFLMVNAAFEAQTGLVDAVGRRMTEFRPFHEARWFETYGRIALTGRAERFERRAEALGRWFEVFAFRTGAPERRQVAVLFKDVLTRKRAEAALRASEERQAFLLALGDAMRREESADGLIGVACRLLGEKLAASRIVFAEIDEAAGMARVRTGWAAENADPHPLELRLADFGGPLLDDLRSGRTVRFDDVGQPPYARRDLAALAAIGVRAGLSVPLIVSGRLVVNLNVHQHDPRAWSDAEVELTEAVAERVWAALARARAEEALRDSNRRLTSLVEGVPQLVWRAAGGAAWTWTSPQWTAFTGQPEGESHGRGWLGAVHPDDREEVLRLWAGAEAAGRFEAEHRLRRAGDGAFRWFQSRATPLRDDAGAVVEWLGTSTDVQDLRALQDRQGVLLHELQHRVRNTLAVVRSIASSTGQTSETVEDFAAHFEGRLNALARTQMVLTRAPGEGVDLEGLVRDELLAQVARDEVVEVDGSDVRLSPKAAEVLALAVHELATNAVKYGALSAPGGRVAVRWSTQDRVDGTWLALTWEESGVRVASAAPRREGFGTELIAQRVPYELSGRGALHFRPGGVCCRIEFPLVAGESILQTDAPRVAGWERAAETRGAASVNVGEGG